MIEGVGSEAGSGSIPLTNGTGSGRPKNMWIRWIRIRKTGFFVISPAIVFALQKASALWLNLLPSWHWKGLLVGDTTEMWTFRARVKILIKGSAGNSHLDVENHFYTDRIWIGSASRQTKISISNHEKIFLSLSRNKSIYCPFFFFYLFSF